MIFFPFQYLPLTITMTLVCMRIMTSLYMEIMKTIVTMATHLMEALLTITTKMHIQATERRHQIQRKQKNTAYPSCLQPGFCSVAMETLY